MKYTIDPGRAVDPITVFDNVTYSTVTKKDGTKMELKMSISAAFGNSEMKALHGLAVPEDIPRRKRPAMIWFNGGGWRGADKNMQLAEYVYLVEHGYVLACVYYRSSAEGQFPDQIIDAKTAVRFLRANAELYSIDPDRIGVFGRSAGGQLAALVGMNDGKYISDEYAEYSSDVKVVYDMFGPVDLYREAKTHLEQEADGSLIKVTKRWATIEDTHEGAVLGGSRETLLERAKQYSPYWQINPKCADFLIMHGTADFLVPDQVSVDFYDRLTEAGIPADLYLLEHGEHGSPEFFQPVVREIVLKWLAEHL